MGQQKKVKAEVISDLVPFVPASSGAAQELIFTSPKCPKARVAVVGVAGEELGTKRGRLDNVIQGLKIIT